MNRLMPIRKYHTVKLFILRSTKSSKGFKFESAIHPASIFLISLSCFLFLYIYIYIYIYIYVCMYTSTQMYSDKNLFKL